MTWRDLNFRDRVFYIALAIFIICLAGAGIAVLYIYADRFFLVAVLVCLVFMLSIVAQEKLHRDRVRRTMTRYYGLTQGVMDSADKTIQQYGQVMSTADQVLGVAGRALPATQHESPPSGKTDGEHWITREEFDAMRSRLEQTQEATRERYDELKVAYDQLRQETSEIGLMLNQQKEISSLPQKPQPGASREEWFRYKYECDLRKIRFTHNELAAEIGVVEGYVRNLYSAWKEEHKRVDDRH